MHRGRLDLVIAIFPLIGSLVKIGMFLEKLTVQFAVGAWSIASLSQSI